MTLVEPEELSSFLDEKIDSLKEVLDEYKTKGDSIISKANGLELMINEFQIPGNPTFNEQHSRYISVCKQFRDVTEKAFDEARAMEGAAQTRALCPNVAEVASVSADESLGQSSKEGMLSDTALGTILEQSGTRKGKGVVILEDDETDETVSNSSTDNVYLGESSGQSSKGGMLSDTAPGPILEQPGRRHGKQPMSEDKTDEAANYVSPNSSGQAREVLARSVSELAVLFEKVRTRQEEEVASDYHNKKRKWGTKLLHRRFWLNLIKKIKS